VKANIITSNSREANSLLASGNNIRINQKTGQLENIINPGDKLVNNATTLRHEEGIVYDNVLIEVARTRLNGIADLQKRGLVKNLGGLGTIISMWERQGDMTGAKIDMDGRTASENDGLTFDEVGVPIPIFHKAWHLGERKLMASRQRGESLDTTQARIASRIVLESMEDALFNGIPNLSVAGLQVYGYTNHPSRNTYTLTANWTSAVGTAIIPDVKAMLQIMLDDYKWGPYVLYVAKDISVNLESDYSSAKGEGTIRDRILKFENISDVKTADFLPNGDVLLVQMDSETVDIAVAQDIRNLTWNIHPLQTEFMVLSAMAPRIKADRNGNCGIVHGS
jgi:hypothetical protein